jgi:hypothetical protein
MFTPTSKTGYFMDEKQLQALAYSDVGRIEGICGEYESSNPSGIVR